MLIIFFYPLNIEFITKYKTTMSHENKSDDFNVAVDDAICSMLDPIDADKMQIQNEITSRIYRLAALLRDPTYGINEVFENPSEDYLNFYTSVYLIAVNQTMNDMNFGRDNRVAYYNAVINRTIPELEQNAREYFLFDLADMIRLVPNANIQRFIDVMYYYNDKYLVFNEQAIYDWVLTTNSRLQLSPMMFKIIRWMAHIDDLRTFLSKFHNANSLLDLYRDARRRGHDDAGVEIMNRIRSLDFS